MHKYIYKYIYVITANTLENPELNARVTINGNDTLIFLCTVKIQFHASLFLSPLDLATKTYGQKIKSYCITAVCLVAIQSWAAQESSNSIKNKSKILSTPVRPVRPKTIFVNLSITY